MLLIAVVLLLNNNIKSKNADDGLKHESAVIISEKNSIVIQGKKSEFIYLIIDKYIKVKLNDEEGKNRFSDITLPENFDPTYIYHNSDIRNAGDYYDKVKMKSYNGKIKKANGEMIETKISVVKQRIRSVSSTNGIYENFVYYEQPHLKIENLEAGDELELNYSYELPFENNMDKLMSFRIFFNGVDFKIDYSMYISGSEKLNFNIKCFNNSKADTIIKEGENLKYFWKKQELYGSIDEAGGRPYMSLPYVVITIKPSEYSYSVPNSTIEKYYPLYSIAVGIREKKELSILLSVIEGVKSKQWLKLDDFINEVTNDIKNDSLGYQKLYKVHNTIADDFKYLSDSAFFNRDDQQMERMGEFTASKQLREISRFDLYTALIYKLGLNFFTAYPIDKRFGEISEDFVKPMFDSDYLFGAVLKNSTLQFMYPKNSRFGYYMNEMPFYFENTKVQLVNLNDYRNKDLPIKEDMRIIYTPFSKLSENERKSSVKVDINIENKTVSFNGNILLRGQYSTMTRGLYQYNYKTKTVNDIYNKKIYEISPEVKLISKSVNIKEKYFPFKTLVNAQYITDKLVEANDDGTYRLKLNNWFNHVIYKNLKTENRQLDFYPDFKGNDTYTYLLKFNKNIELVAPFEKVNISNEFANLIIEINKTDANTLTIQSMFVTKTDKISPDKIQQVKEVYDKIEELNKSIINFKITE